MDNNYLQHYGILGMKWGIRRYQNKDGTLTPAGKKRLAKLDAERETLAGKKSGGDNQPPKKRTIRDIPDQELKKMVERERLEKEHLDLTKQIKNLTPEQISRGQKFVNYITNKIVIPAATDASKNFATKFLNAKGDELLSSLTKKSVSK